MSDLDIHKKQDLENVEKQWEQFQDETDLSNIEDIKDDDLRDQIISDLSFVSKMDVKEYTLYQKWQEVQFKYPTVEQTTLMGVERVPRNKNVGEEIKYAKDLRFKIWTPKDPDDYQNLKPVLEYTGQGQKSEKAELSKTWNTFRTFLSTMKNNSNIGRQLFYNVKDDITKHHLGTICISGDFMDLTPRDKSIGWTRELKTHTGKLNHTAIGSSIVPTQPLGFNYTGGKLLAYLCLSKEIADKWEELYGDKLVGVTTTSLYGKSKKIPLSQYDGLKYWKRMGFTTGSVAYEPERETKAKIKNWLIKNHTRKYFEWYVATRPNGQPLKRDHKNRSYQFTFSKLNVPKEIIKSEHARGIYFTRLYQNTDEFLRGEIELDKLTPAFDNSTEALVNIWKEKHARKRIESLKKSGNISTETLWYADLIGKTWSEAKESYLNQVGR